MGFCDECEVIHNGLMESYKGKSLVKLADNILGDLLTHVINYGEESKALLYIDYYVNEECGCGCDIVYLFQDMNGALWLTKTFYGTLDCHVEIDAISKEEWIDYLMSVSLSMVENFKCIEIGYDEPFSYVSENDYYWNIMFGLNVTEAKEIQSTRSLLYNMFLKQSESSIYIDHSHDFVLFFQGVFYENEEDKPKEIMLAVSGNCLSEVMENFENNIKNF